MKNVWATRTARSFVLAAPLVFLAVPAARSQTLPTAPPNILLLVHQQFKPENEAAHEKLALDLVDACSQLEVPNQWIDLQSISGAPETLSFDPFETFANVDDAYAGWATINASHPDVARMQQDVRAMELQERTIIAVRRGDLSYQASSIDLSKARFMRVLEVRLLPGREAEFTEAFKILRAAYEKIKADTPWVVYQVNVGMPSPTFLAFVPMRTLKQNDDLLAWRPLLREAEGDVAAKRMDQIAKEAYASTESNLYVIRPELSHVSKEFAEGDPDFWTPRLARPESQQQQNQSSPKAPRRMR
jgi:hypothetical protein